MSYVPVAVGVSPGGEVDFAVAVVVVLDGFVAGCSPLGGCDLAVGALADVPGGGGGVKQGTVGEAVSIVVG